MATVTPIRTALEGAQASIVAVLERNPSPNVVIPNKPTNEREAAIAIRNKMHSGTVDSTLEAVRGWRDPLNISEIRSVLDENFGTERDVNGAKLRVAGSPSETRYTNAERVLGLMDKLLTDGYGNLAPAEQHRIVDSAEDALIRIPEVRVYLDGLGHLRDPRRQDAVLRIVNNPAYATHIRNLIEERVNGENGDGIKIPENVTQAKATEEDAKAQKDLAEEAKNDIDTQLKRVDKGLADFTTPDPHLLIPAGSRYKDIDPAEIAKTEDDIVKKSAEIKDLENKKVSYTLQISNENKKSTGGDPAIKDTLLEEIKKADAEIATKKAELAKIQADRERQKKAQEDLKALENEKQQLTAAQREKQQALLKATRELQLAKNGLAKALAERDHAEARFATSIHGILAQAAVETFEDEIAKAEAAQNALVEKAKEEAKSDEEKAILQAITDRYDVTRTVRPPFGRARTVRRPNRPNIRADFEMLIQTPNGGPEAIMRQILTDAHFTPARINNAMADSEFVKKMQPQLLKRLVARRLQVGKMRESDVRLFVESDWGEGVIDNAIQNNNDVRAAIEKLREQGLAHGSFINFLRNTNVGSRLSWIAAILGIVALPVAALA